MPFAGDPTPGVHPIVITDERVAPARQVGRPFVGSVHPVPVPNIGIVRRKLMLIFEALVEIGRIGLFGIKARAQGLIAPVLLRRELNLQALFERQAEKTPRGGENRFDIRAGHATLSQVEEPATFAGIADFARDLRLSRGGPFPERHEIDDGHVSHQALQAISFASAKTLPRRHSVVRSS
jgi:hypothetical protein